MPTMQCPHCQSAIQMEADGPIRFCPFCGRETTPDAGPSALARRLQAEKKPKEKYRIIREALEAAPDDFEANKALLFHGRLHEPMQRKRGIDFSIIKSHLLSVFDRPDAFTLAEQEAMYAELLEDPQLKRTMALAPDAGAFFDEYVHRLAFEYIDLFIRGDSRYSTVAFGLPRSPASLARQCAGPVRKMVAAVMASDRLTEAQRLLFAQALRAGYARLFAGYAGNLDG